MRPFRGVGCWLGALAVAAACWPTSEMTAAAPFAIVRDGEAEAVIVVQPVIKARQVAVDEFTFPGKYNVPPSQWAQTLQSYLKRITGAELPIVSSAPAEAGTAAIHVGLTEFVAGLRIPFGEHDRDTIILKRVKNQVVLVGKDDWGTEIAVYDFLERVCGVRWLLPGPLGEVVPEAKDILVGELDRVETPSFRSRSMSGIQVNAPGRETAREARTWMKRNRLRERYKFHHNLGKIFRQSKYGKEHPEYFPFIGGKRVVPRSDRKPSGWQVCYSNPDVLKISVDTARDYFDRFPVAVGFSLGQNDCWGFCQCDGCLKMNGAVSYDACGKRNYSPICFKFMNMACEELEKTHPGKKLGCLIYGSGTRTPPPFKLHPNVVGYIPNDRSRFAFDPGFRKEEQEYLEAWSQKADTLGIYEWHYGNGFLVPRLQLKSTQAMLKFGYSKGVKAYYAEEYPNWGLEGPKTYITARLLWDVDANVEALLDDFCEKFFEDAARPMRRYYAALEEAWNSQPIRKAPFICTYLLGQRAQFDIFTLGLLEQCAGCLDEAAKLAKSTLVQQRLATIRESFRVSQYYAERESVFNSIQVGEEQTPETFAEIVDNMNRMACTTFALRRHMNARIHDDPYTFYSGLWPKRDRSWSKPVVWGMGPYYCEIGAKIAGALVRAESRRRKAGEKLSQERLAAALGPAFEALSTCMREPDPKFPRENEGPAWPSLRDLIPKYIKACALVPRLAAAPAIDGKAGEKEWASAAELIDFVTLGKGASPKFLTTVRVGYDDRALYVAYLCQEESVANLIARCNQRDSAVWEDDAVDFVILPAGVAKKDFAHFIINNIGAFYDARGAAGSDWNAEFAAATGKDEKANTWTVEASIPWATIGQRPKSGEIWRAQFGRINPFGSGGSKRFREFSSWCFSPTGFNNADYLGVLLFE